MLEDPYLSLYLVVQLALTDATAVEHLYGYLDPGGLMNSHCDAGARNITCRRVNTPMCSTLTSHFANRAEAEILPETIVSHRLQRHDVVAQGLQPASARFNISAGGVGDVQLVNDSVNQDSA